MFGFPYSQVIPVSGIRGKTVPEFPPEFPLFTDSFLFFVIISQMPFLSVSFEKQHPAADIPGKSIVSLLRRAAVFLLFYVSEVFRRFCRAPEKEIPAPVTGITKETACCRFSVIIFLTHRFPFSKTSVGLTAMV